MENFLTFNANEKKRLIYNSSNFRHNFYIDQKILYIFLCCFKIVLKSTDVEKKDNNKKGNTNNNGIN